MTAQQSPLSVWIPLRWGRFTGEFDPAGGWLRSVAVDGHEVVRAIYGAVRDRNWATVSPRLRGLRVEQHEDQFRIAFEAECVAAGIEFRWEGEIVGEADGTLAFRFAGEALTGFWRNRIGLCMLHPIEGCAGKRCQVETVEGGLEDGVFPQFIAPHEPFQRVRSITYEAAPGTRLWVGFGGEVFETEDQRNWTDASFKTYGTPLAEPFPVWIERGTRVEQWVAFRLHEITPPGPASQSVPAAMIPELRLADEFPRPLPGVGFGMASHGAALTPREAAWLRRLQPAHLRVDLHLGDEAWRAHWRLAAADAAAIGTSLQVAVFVTDAAAREFAELAAEVVAHPARISLWLIFHANESSTNACWVRLAEVALPGGAPFAAGTNANFAELNRRRPAAAETALPCFSISPQVHAGDDASLIENLGAQAATVASARQFAPRPVVISPITLRPRFNPVATADDAPVAQALPAAVDARQRSLFAAAWTVGSLARLAALEGVHSLTYYETTGWRGVMETAAGSPMPELFPSLAGEVFPVYHVFAALAGTAGIIPTVSTQPTRFDGFCLVGHDGRRCWVISNLTDRSQLVRVRVGATSARVVVLDGDSSGIAIRLRPSLAGEVAHPTSSGHLEVELDAYASARITPEA